MGRPRKIPSVFDYVDYRPFLRDVYRARKALDPSFSYGSFARHAGIPSRSHFKQVMDGEKPLTGRFLDRYAKGLRLGPEEAGHLRLLMERVHAPDERAREAVGQALHEARFHREDPVPPVVAAVLSREWNLRLVFALTRVDGFRADPAWISRRLKGTVGASEARKALGFLKAKGLIRVKGGRLLRSSAGRVPIKARVPVGVILKRMDRIRREAGRFGECHSDFSLVALTPREALELIRQFRQVYLGVPGREQTRPGTELYLVQTLLMRLSRREDADPGHPFAGGGTFVAGRNSVPRPVNAASEGESLPPARRKA